MNTNREKEKVGIGVVGCGRIGLTHLDGVKRCGRRATIAAVVDIDESRARKTAENFDTKYYTSIESALTDPRIDAMVMCLPHDQHFPAAMEAMRGGRHVLVEKPLATNVKDAVKMIEFSRQQKLVLLAGMSRRHFFAFHHLKKRMETDIGSPFNLLYVLACFFDERIAPPWWRKEEKTGGLTFAMCGSHSIDFTLWMFENKVPVRVYAEAKSVNRMFEGYDEVSLVIKFDDGAIATNFLSINARAPRHEGLILGPKGSAHFSYTADKTGLVGTGPPDLHINGELVMSGEQNPHNFAVQIDEFASAILEKREPWVKLDQIKTQIEIIEAARESVNIKKPVYIQA